LSHHSDRLAALSGLAAVYQRTSDEYICGLWRSDLVRSLMWKVKEYHTDKQGAFGRAVRISQSQQDYDAPSWSWAAVTGEIKFDKIGPGFVDSEFDMEFLGVAYDTSKTNPYGPLKNCYIKARGCLLPVRLDDEFSFLFNTSRSPDDPDLETASLHVSEVILDVHTGEMARHDIITQKVLFFTLIQTSKTEFMPRDILLRAVEDELLPETFRRIGYVRPVHMRVVSLSVIG
jgi:hypothetical protein